VKAAKCPRGFPQAWANDFISFKVIDETLKGSQTLNAWFATRTDGTKVFIKQYFPSHKPAALEEISIYDRLQGKSCENKPHENVIGLLAHAEEDGSIFTVAELLGGGDLYTHIERAYTSEPYSEEEVRKTFLWLLMGTKFLHERGVAHRDLKPENVMGGARSNYIKLVDLGMAKYFDEVGKTGGSSESIHACKDPNNPAGLPNSGVWTCPEQRAGQADQNPFLCDIYGLGCLLYTLFKGEMPPNTPNDIKMKVDDPSDKSINPAAKSLIKKMTAYQDQRIDIHQVIDDPWISANLGPEGHKRLADDVLARLVKLAQTKTIRGKPNEWFVHEVNTRGSHMVTSDKMGTLYDITNPIELSDIPEEDKKTMDYWDFAKTQSMQFFKSLQTKHCVEVTAATLDKLMAKWPSDPRASTAGEDGQVMISKSESHPTSQEVFDFVHAKVLAKDEDFVTSNRTKRGVFGRQLKGATSRREEDIEVWANEDDHKKGARFFVFKSPYEAVHVDLLTLFVGDALVYEPEKKPIKMYVLEATSLRKNFFPPEITSSLPGAAVAGDAK
jgi:serine/threonine protein kinase